MKKLLNLLMVFLFVSAMVACGGTAETEEPTPADEDSTTVVEDSTAQQDIATDSTEVDSTATDGGEH